MAGVFGPAGLQAAQMQVMQEQFERANAVQENAGLGLVNDAQVAMLDAQNAGLRFGATGPQYLFCLRKIAANEYENLVEAPKATRMDPLRLAAALRACNVLQLEECNAIQDALVKSVLGSTDMESKPKTRACRKKILTPSSTRC